MRNSSMYRRLYYARRRSGFRLRTIFIVISTITILFLAVTYTQNKVYPYIMEVSEIKTRKIVLDVVETAIKEEFGDTVLYDDIVLVARDSTKRIASIQTNATRLGILTSKITAGIQDKMLSDREERVGIPLGAFIGSTLFSAEGPDIYVKYIPAGKVDINYKSEFTQLGVNQLKHIVNLQVRVLMGISLPFAGNEREIVIYVPLVENIIVGNMPTIIDK